MTDNVERAWIVVSTAVVWYFKLIASFFVHSYNKAIYCIMKPVPMAAQCKARTVFDRPNIGIAGSNPARGMDICQRFSVLCCPV